MLRPSLLVLLLALSAAGCSEFRYKPLYTSPVDTQREAARTIAPARLDGPAPGEPAPAERRTVRVRVWADADFRAQTLRWEEAIRLQLERATAFALPRYGVTFEVESLRPWEHGGSAPLEEVLGQLERLDAGGDVDLVLGFVTALPVFTASQHQLGVARLLGRHAVLRSMENAGEAQAIAEGLHLLGEEERGKLTRERRLHKEVAVFLHEWGHTLGAVHVEAHDSLMFPSYDAQQSTFGPARDAVLLGVRYHASAGKDAAARTAWYDALRVLATTRGAETWDRVERNQLLAQLGGERAPSSPARASLPTRLTATELAQLGRAGEHARAGRLAEARAALGELPARYPGEFTVQLLTCELAVRQTPRDAAAQRACTLAAEMQRADPLPWLLLGRGQAERKDLAAAVESASSARLRLGLDASAPPELWGALANLCAQLSLVTWAEEAAAHAPSHEASVGAKAWAAQARRAVALPADAARHGVPPEQEGAYLEAVRGGMAELDAGNTARAGARVAALRKGYPKAPGASLLECALAVRTNRPAEARAPCERVLKQAPEAVPAHLLLAAAEAGLGRWPSATRHAERVLELDASQRGAWQMLAYVYRMTGKPKQLETLRSRFRAQFSAELP